MSLLSLLKCPQCHMKLDLEKAKNHNCFVKNEHWVSFCTHDSIAEEKNRNNKEAYEGYSRFYPIIALLAYTIVWRGNIFKHIAFFKSILDQSNPILDIAIGDGSLTRASLYKDNKRRPQELIGIDISDHMLEKAKKNFQQEKVILLQADVLRLPFEDDCIQTLSCFGGFNSFPSGEKAMKELARIMAKGATMRGSVLFLPTSEWRRRLVLKWIDEGYQSEVVTHEIFISWVNKAGLKLKQSIKMGDVMLFELEKK